MAASSCVIGWQHRRGGGRHGGIGKRKLIGGNGSSTQRNQRKKMAKVKIENAKNENRRKKEIEKAGRQQSGKPAKTAAAANGMAKI